jgi:hypothetical protein
VVESKIQSVELIEIYCFQKFYRNLSINFQIVLSQGFAIRKLRCFHQSSVSSSSFEEETVAKMEKMKDKIKEENKLLKEEIKEIASEVKHLTDKLS